MSLKNLNLDELVRSATGVALKEILSPLLEDEKKKQDAMEAELSELESSDDKKDDLDEADDEEEESGDDTEDAVKTKVATGKDVEKEEEAEPVVPSPEDLANVKPEQIINLLNMMRSGKSTKDAEVQKSLKGYFQGMDAGERQALFIMMSGLSQILAGGVEGEEAPDPSAVGIKIMAKRATQDMSSAEKAVAKEKSKTKKGEKPRPGDEEAPIKVGGGDEDLADLPIKVGEVADKRKIRQKLRILT